MSKQKGLLVDVIGTDCTNNGVTSGKTKAVLIGPGIPEIFEPSDDAPALEFSASDEQTHTLGRRVVPRKAWLREIGIEQTEETGDFVLRAYAHPVSPGSRFGMFGGHWLITSDSRFPFDSPIPVHDRFEP